MNSVNRVAPGWTGVVIGLLVGLLVGSIWLFLRERGVNTELYAEQPPASVFEQVEEVGGGETPSQFTSVSENETDLGISAGRRTALVRATERVAPAVVSINVIEHRIYRDRYWEYWERHFPGVFPRREFRQDVQSLGSGFIVSADGFVLTNYHVISSGHEIVVTLTDGREFTAEVRDVAPRYDLALLQISGEDLPVAPLATDNHLHIGEWAIAIGSPFGYLLADTQPTVTVGVISALNRAIKHSDGQRDYLGMIQTDAAINPGNSGGPLVNADGEVIGINTFIFSESGGSIGIGFAVPIERANWLINEVAEHGRYREAYIGLLFQRLSPNLIRALGLKDTVGFLIKEVDEDSPAWKAGLRVWDVMRKINGVKLTDTDTLMRLVYDAKVGTVLSYEAERDGERFSGQIVLEESPSTSRQ